MLRGSYCQQVMTFLFFGSEVAFQSGTPLFKKSGSAPVMGGSFCSTSGLVCCPPSLHILVVHPHHVLCYR